MPERISLSLAPADASDLQSVAVAAGKKLDRAVDVHRLVVVRRSVDARKRPIRVNLGLDVYADGETMAPDAPAFAYQDVRQAPPVIIVGAGPAGLFAALRLLELGHRPVVLERGKPVGERRRDVAALNRRGILDPESNYAFGEGGAGTFSDGKLYTRSKKRGDHRRVLHRFHQHGADPAILCDTHPHIGSNRLPGVVQAMRETIRFHGGEVHFRQAVAGLLIDAGRVVGVRLADGGTLRSRAVILATGHSSRDVYAMLAGQGIVLAAKGFAMGVRVEHPQRHIDRIQYHGQGRGEYLPPAAYTLVQQVDGRGVYSFCMCPGGYIVPATTETDAMVVNGMSFARRNGPFANAGIVVEIDLEDIPGGGGDDALRGLGYQRALERLAFRHGGGGVVAPAQRLADFVAGRASTTLPDCSYPPGGDRIAAFRLASPIHSSSAAGRIQGLRSSHERVCDQRCSGGWRGVPNLFPGAHFPRPAYPAAYGV